MEFNFENPGLSEKEVSDILSNKRKLTEPGRYTMRVQSISARVMGDTGKYRGEIFLTHAAEENKALGGVTLDLFKSKDNPARNSEVSQKFLTVLGKSLGLTPAELGTITWAAASHEQADKYGMVPAAVAVMRGGTYEPISLEGVLVEAVVDIKDFERKDGSAGQKNIVKGISLLQE